MNGKHYIGAKAQSANNVRLYPAISKVILWVDDNNYYEAGTDGGFVIEQDCPYATQAMADNLLVKLGGYQYQSITAEAAQLTPTAELGDGITVNGVYTQLAYKNIRFSTGAVVDVAAPGGVEVDHEYVQKGNQEREFDRKIAQTYSQISKTAEEIKLEVASTIDELSASIDIQIDSITSTVEGQSGQISQISQEVDSITQEVRGLDGQIASIETYVDSITLSVSNGSTSSTISLKAGSTTISSKTISMSGLVTYTGLANGTTTIDGGCIKTGTIDADRLNLTGAITFQDLNSSTQSTINNASTNAANAVNTANRVSNTLNGLTTTVGYTTYIDGSKIETSQLYVNSANITGSITASTIRGGTVQLLDGSGWSAGTLSLTSASSSSYSVQFASGAAMRLKANGGVVWLESSTGAYLNVAANVVVGTNLQPAGDNNYTCGVSGARWADIYSANSVINVSDRREKTDIAYDLSAYDAAFDSLKPASFKFVNGTSGRTHTGFISQDIEDALEPSGLTSTDFAAFIKSPLTDKSGTIIQGEYRYGIRYEELIALCVAQIQALKKRVSELEKV